MSNKTTFQDFCLAWKSRFPQSELPAAWEEDVRSNLAKHKAKVESLREELEKEEMYVEYLDKLLVDIELHRRQDEQLTNEGDDGNVNEDQCKNGKSTSRTSLNLDLDQGHGPNGSSFVTVISVVSTDQDDQDVHNPSLTGRQDSKESLNSSSSLLSPSSSISLSETPLLLKDPLSTQDVSSNSGSTSGMGPKYNKKPEPPKRSTKPRTFSNTSNDNIDLQTGSRGQPDGGETDDSMSLSLSTSAKSSNSQTSSNVSKVKGIWEDRAELIGFQPLERKSKHTESLKHDSRDPKNQKIMRRQLSSPSGKSYDSSDSEYSLGRRESNKLKDDLKKPEHLKKQDAVETRLDRLVLRKPSDRLKKSNGKLSKNQEGSSERTKPMDEPLYDLVASDEPENEYEYDNHLLYSGSKIQNAFTASSTPTNVKDQSLKDSDNLSSTSSLVRKTVQIEDEESNYVNIQYFLHNSKSRSMDDRENSFDNPDESEDDEATDQATNKYSSLDSNQSKDKSINESERQLMYKHILNSIADSESIYLECLSVSLQYMKAMKVTLSTPQPIIPKEDFDVIFFKIPELHEFHYHFHESLKKQVDHYNSKDKIGHHFKMLAQQTKLYAQFLGNYPQALETLHKCSQTYPQFADLTGSIKLRTLKGQQQSQTLSLEDLLHKPVARLQKNCLSLQDLIKYTPEDHPDHRTLEDSLHMIQNFLNDYNVEHRTQLYPHTERNQRHLVKNSFTVELTDGARKLRHLFLFNDVLVCAKYKASSRGEKFTFQLKWYIPLSEILIVEEPSIEPKENKPANIVSLKTSASSLRDIIMRTEKEDEWKGKGRSGGRNIEKLRRNLSELEAQLVLASPHLVFQVSSKSGKTYSIYLSSEYERSQWVEALKVLQERLPPNTSQHYSMSMVELQSWVTSCRKFLKTNMGSFLMRSMRDEPLLIGDLHMVITNLNGLTRPSDNIHVVIEVDSYGHYFRKVKTRSISGSIEPTWNDEFIIDLEGSENVRILVYEDSPQGTVLRGKATLELSRSWLGVSYSEQRISVNDLMLKCQTKYQAFEETICRVPAAKSTGLFKTSIGITTKKEKRAIPFIITSTIREVERRGISEVGIYRVSGSATDMAKLKRAYESNPYEAEQLLKECDIHSVAGILKQYLRDLPESIFTKDAYENFLNANSISDNDSRTQTYLNLLSHLPQNPNQACIVFLIEHLVKVASLEQHNKMSLHNLATVFGPTMLHSGPHNKKSGDILASSTVDVMAQSGVLLFFLSRRSKGEPIQILERTL